MFCNITDKLYIGQPRKSLFLQCLGNSTHLLVSHRLFLYLQYKDEEVLQI